MVSMDGIRLLVEPVLAAAGLELWDVELERNILRIRVDRPGGVDLSALASATGLISQLLDDRADLAPTGRYELEVSSPGVERVLRTVDQYRRYTGTEVTVKTAVAVSGGRRHQGTLVAVDDHGISLSSESAGVLDISYDQIERARTVLVWGPTPAPGSGGRRKRTTPRRSTAPVGASPVASAESTAAFDTKDTGS
jgi:ribosome maturation factor RimP